MLGRIKKYTKDRRGGKPLEVNTSSGDLTHPERWTGSPQDGMSSSFDIVEYLTKIEELANFDACVETSDALAAASPYTQSSTKIDKTTGLKDCSVLVSPDGDLLLLPEEQNGKPIKNEDGEEETSDDKTENDDNSEPALVDAEPFDRSSIRLLNANADVDSSIFMGDDLRSGGDKDRNGFTAMGWSPSATSLAIRQTEESIRVLATFAEDLILARKEQAARASRASDNLRTTSASPHYNSDSVFFQQGREAERETSAGSADSQISAATPESLYYEPTRVGPLIFAGGTIAAATTALEQYHSVMAENDANRWRMASLSNPSSETLNGVEQNHFGVLTSLRKAAEVTAERSYKREKALREMQRRATAIENRLVQTKGNAKQRWDAVHQAEEQVTKILEERMLERSRERERQRMEEFNKKIAEDDGKADLGATQNEIWDLVSSVAESMEDGSFEPTGLPGVPVYAPQDQSDQQTPENTDERDQSPTNGQPLSPSVSDIPMISRDEVEDELNLQELRSAALAADEIVEDTAGSLLNVLSTLDTTRRSARVAAETCLLSAANSQAQAIRSLVALERESIEERLRNIEALEQIVDKIDVRKDLNGYIEVDKKERKGSTWLGEDDDGGIASALAVLSSHVEGSTGTHGASKPMVDGWEEDDAEDEQLTAENIEDCIELVFDESSMEGEKLEDYEASVNLLCAAAADKKSQHARFQRSTMCYAINQKRSSNAELKDSVQFDAVCRIFDAILTGCDREAGGVANAKMCMMLSQTFYMVDDTNVAPDDDSPATRDNRIFVKTRLVDHLLWKDEEFWDQALYQCVTESLTHSGVMANFERSVGASHNSEWTRHRKLMWHDLKLKERTQAAAQVHAVVFAQLGALAHSMIEFGCGIDRSSAFVRRMAIRNQLPISQRRILLQHLLSRDG